MAARTTSTPDLIWECIKKDTCFLRKSNGHIFTQDPLNMAGRHTKRHTGLTGNGAGIIVEKGRFTLKMSKKKASKQRLPSRSTTQVKLSGNKKQSLRKLKKALFPLKGHAQQTAVRRYLKLQQGMRNRHSKRSETKA
eukprot:GHVU01012509.1.p2 GENE.GHVU01012509.1~~GHVU01012509.1.p2  ORF type:complete len:137 (+),score=18.46 GHVU01012509.1:54-464(+)